MKFLRIFRMGLLVGARDFSLFWNWKTWLGGWMLRITTNVFLWVLMGRMLAQPTTLHYLLVGFGATAGVGTFAVAAGSWDHFDGTYSLLVVSPGGVAASLMGRTAIWVFTWIASALLTFAAVTIVFSWPLSWARWLGVAGIEPALCLSTYCFTVFLGAVTALASRLRNMVNGMLVIVLSALTGVSVPVTFWPRWLQVIIGFLPITHGLAAIRLVVAGADPFPIIQEVAKELLVAAGWLGVALLVVDRLANAGRAKGTLDNE